DVLQQAGSSGSPIFYDDRPVVVGMMASGMIDNISVPVGNVSLTVPRATNISIAVPAHIIEPALASFRQSPWAIDTSGLPTVEAWKLGRQPSDKIDWDRSL